METLREEYTIAKVMTYSQYDIRVSESGKFLNFNNDVHPMIITGIRREYNKLKLGQCITTKVGSLYIGHLAEDLGYIFRVDYNRQHNRNFKYLATVTAYRKIVLDNTTEN